MKDFSLIETLRWQPDAGFIRFDLHLARLAASARTLGFEGADKAGAALESHQKTDHALRVRLALFADGRIEVTSAHFTPLGDVVTWKLKIAATRLDSANRLLAHKTSKRECYDKARAEFSREQADEVLLLNEHGAVCEGSITSLFVDDGGGQLLTPPISQGLLAGVLRTQLICTKKARVRPLFPKDLRGRKLFVGNSLRGLIPASLD